MTFDQFFDARQLLHEDFFGGWEPDDLNLINPFLQKATPRNEFILDCFGIYTRNYLHPWAAHLHSSARFQAPIPDDTLRAEAIEYVALAYCLNATPGRRFSVVELGASYAPWACLSLKLAQRAGKTELHAIAVEASGLLHAEIEKHFLDNGLDSDVCSLNAVKAAVSDNEGTAFFPILTDPGNNGSQISEENVSIDYVNREVEHEEVRMYPIEHFLSEPVVDLLHIDIQGHEFAAVQKSISAIKKSARFIFIGTHSRLIEGQLIELLHSEGFELIRERPTRFDYVADRPNVVGWTTRDGGQFWRNTAIR